LVALVLQYLGNGRGVEHRGVTGVEDGIPCAHAKIGVGILRASQDGVFESFHRALIQRCLRAERPHTEPEQGQAVAERCQGLAEDVVLLSGQLREQSGDALRGRLIDSAAGDQLIDQALDALSAQGGQSRGGNVVQGELVGDLHAEAASELVVNLEDLNIEHDLGTRLAPVLHELGDGLKHAQGSAYRDLASLDRLAQKPHIEQNPNGVGDFIEISRIAGGYVKGSHSQAVKLAVVLVDVLQQVDLLFRQRGEERARDLTSGPHGGEEISAVDIEMHAPGDHRIVNFRLYTEGGGHLKQKGIGVAAEVEFLADVVGDDMEFT